MADNGLYFFYSKTCPFTRKTQPAVEHVENALGAPLIKLETSLPENYALYQKYSIDRCRGVPFFYNENTEEYICGSTSPEMLRKWAHVEDK